VSGPARWTTTPFSEQRQQLLSDESLQGPAFCRAYAGLVDRWLVELLGDEPDVALVAVGSYGREELAPGSDLDLVLVYQKRRDVEEIARRVWYPIWEEGITLDHSVKTVHEALAVAAGDLKAQLGLLDARTVAGDTDLGGSLQRRARESWHTKRERWIPLLDEATRERHERAGDVAFLLEPDLKEGRGGLRDVHALHALTLAIDTLPEPDDAVTASADVLLTTRVALHRQTRRATDRLLLQEQDGVATELGFKNADALMQQVSSAARTVSWTADDAWRRARTAVAGTRGRAARAERPFGEGIVLRDEEVVLAPDASFADATLPIRVATASAESGLPIGRSTLERLRADAAAPADPWAPGTVDALVALFATGAASIPAFEALDQYGLITRLLPEWEPVRCRLQHNPYHRFTVDRHLLEATAQAAALTDRVRRPDLLLVGAWLHDLGKGYPGDHTDVGVELMAQLGPRMGFGPPDVEILSRLVRDHLLLADAATRRDIQDPATLTQVAAAVCDEQTLRLLAALTEADSKATGDSAWSEWKASLIAELVERVADVIAGAQPELQEAELAPELQALADEAAGGVLVRGSDGEVVIVAPDRPGLFCQLSGLLAMQGLDVLEADLNSTVARPADTPTAVDVFRVQLTRGDHYDWKRFESNLAKVLDGRLALEARLAESARSYKRRPQRRAGEHVKPGVVVHNDASERASVVEVRSGNAIGVLYRIARALLDMQLDLRRAKVQTLGDEVVDTFYVVDASGKKLGDEERLGELRRAVLFELSRLEL
jgi:[protein-PII] uridylyltransferase